MQCFTLDEKRSQAVTEAFVRLYKEKLIYRFVSHTHGPTLLFFCFPEVLEVSTNLNLRSRHIFRLS